MKINPRFAVVLLPLLTFAGCGSPDLAPTPPRNEPYALQPVVFSGQDDLSNHVTVGTISKTIDISGLMHLTVQVRDTNTIDLYVDYRVTYFDDNHTPVDMPTAWQTKTLHSNVFEYIEANASTPRAKDFQIDIRTAQ